MVTSSERNRRKLLFVAGFLAGIVNLWVFLLSIIILGVFPSAFNCHVLLYKQEQMAFDDFLNLMFSNNPVHEEYFLLNQVSGNFWVLVLLWIDLGQFFG